MTDPRIVAAWLAAATVLGAQEPQPAAPVFPSTAEVVTIDVVVTDDKGAPVAGLGREDFVIREDGQGQGLTLFEAIARSGAAPSVEISRTAVSDNRTPDASRPLLLIAFDEPHLTPSGVERARREVGNLPDHPELRGTDVVLVSTAGGGSWLARLPEGGADLAAALTRFRGLRPMIASGRMKDYEAFQIAARRNEQVLTQVYRRYMDMRLLPDITSPNNKGMRGYQGDASAAMPAAGRDSLLAEGEQRWQDIRRRQAATIAGLTRLLGSLDPRGRKALLLITEGFIQESAAPDYSDLAEAARRAHAALHVVDPRDSGRLFSDDADTSSSVDSRDHIALMARELKSAEGADALALATGGRVLRNLPGLPAEVQRLGSELRTYYLLGYEPKVGADGRFHKLAVEVTRPGLHVAARPGYYAIKSSTPSAAGAALPQVALESAADASALPARLSGYVLGPTRKGKSRVRLVAELDGAAFASGGAPLDVVFQLAARERPGAQQWSTEVKAPAPDKSVRLEAEFEAEPGVYQARVLARERASQRMGSVRHTLEVRPLDEFRTTTPVLTDLADGSVPVPRADRRFRRDAKLFCLIEVLGASGRDTVTAGMDLRQPQGPVLLHIPASALTSAQLSRLWAIPLRDLAPGAYELTISVQETGSSREVRLQEGFEVVAN